MVGKMSKPRSSLYLRPTSSGKFVLLVPAHDDTSLGIPDPHYHYPSFPIQHTCLPRWEPFHVDRVSSAPNAQRRPIIHLFYLFTYIYIFFMLLFAFISSQIVKRIQQNRNNQISSQTTRNLIIMIIKKETTKQKISGPMTERKGIILYTRIWTWCFRREI